MTRQSASPQQRLVTRARRVLTVQIAATVTVVVALVGGVALAVLVTNQRTDEARALSVAAHRSSQQGLPPCTWVYERHGSSLTHTPGAPSGLPVRAAMDEAATRRTTLQERYRVRGINYLVRTQARGTTAKQVVLDLRDHDQERYRYYLTLVVSEIVGLAAALATGWLLSRRAIAPLGEAIDRQRRFVADASHELRTPLTQLHTRAQLLRRRRQRYPEAPVAEGDLEQIVASTRQLGEVIDDLLRSAQLRHEPDSYTKLDLGDLVADTIAAERIRADAAGVELRLERRPGPFGAVVGGIEPALRRAVAALVDNAIGHTPPGGHVRVYVTTLRRGRRPFAELAISDDGVGFAPDSAEQIFQRSNHGQHGDGPRFGIGLALVREIVESHGGTITATGAVGSGATFTIDLPCAADVPRPSPDGDNHAPSPSAPAEPARRSQAGQPGLTRPVS